MEAHARWLIRVGAVMLFLHPYASYALILAQSLGVPVPPGWLPLGSWGASDSGSTVYYSWTLPFSPLHTLAEAFILGLPVLASFASLRRNHLLLWFQVIALLLLTFILLRQEWLVDTRVPRGLRLGIPVLAAGWVMGMVLLGFEEAGIGRAARAFIGIELFFYLVLSWVAGPRWMGFFMGYPLGLLGAVLLTGGELLYPRPRPAASATQP